MLASFHLVLLCFAVAFVLPHIEHAIHSFLPHTSCPPHLRCTVCLSLTLKPSTVALVLEVPGLTTLRAPRVTHDLTPVTMCVCVCSPHSAQPVSSMSTFIKLGSDETFDTWKAQLLIYIEKVFSLDNFDFTKYETGFTISHVVVLPILVIVEEEYNNMLERIMKMKDSSCSVYIQELVQIFKAFKFPL